MLDSAKRKMMQQAMSNVTPSETPVVQALAEIIAGLENEQATAMQRLVDAAGIEDRDVRHDVAAREQQLLSFADAVAEGRVAEFYADEMGIDDVDRALNHLNRDDWPEQKREWYQQYRERDIVSGPDADEADDSDINRAAQMHITEVFGVSLSAFEQHIIEWDRGAAVQELLAGPLVGHTQLIDHIATELDDNEP